MSVADCLVTLYDEVPSTGLVKSHNGSGQMAAHRMHVVDCCREPSVVEGPSSPLDKMIVGYVKDARLHLTRTPSFKLELFGPLFVLCSTMDHVDFQQLKSGEVNLGVCFSSIPMIGRNSDLATDLNYGCSIRQGCRDWRRQPYNHRQLHRKMIT